ETDTASSIVRAVEAAMKGTPVDLVEVRLSDTGLAGKGIALLAGTLHDVDAAAALAAAGTSSEAPPRGFSHRIIPAPHDVLALDPWFVPVDHAIIAIVDGVNVAP